MGYTPPADYIDVAERIRQFRERYPEGTLQQVEWGVREIGNKAFVYYTAAAYRTPDDPRPGIGTAWEPFPGPTPYTRDSELMNAETSAWGRAIIAAGAADAKRVASANEVANRRATPASSDTSEQLPTPNPAAVEPAAEFVFKFGKHKGDRLDAVPAEYLRWLLKQPARAGYELQHKKQHDIYRSELLRRGESA